MKVSIAYAETCLPDYFSGDHRPWVTLYPSEAGYTSRELREHIMSEFTLGAVGGSDPIARDFIPDERDQKRADMFFEGGKLVACLNRDIKYRGKRHKFSDYDIKPSEIDNLDYVPMLYVVFDIED